jgi:hypothetical protein
MMDFAFFKRLGISAPGRRFYCLILAIGHATLMGHGTEAQTRTIELGKTPSHYWMNDAPAFWRDSQWDLHLRTYYFDRDNFNGSTSQAWAGGGWIGWQSGFIHDVFQIGATLYTSQPIYAPDGQGGTLLLTSDQEQITTLGQAFVRARIQKQDLTAGRQIVDTPLIGLRDNRMIPITFEGVTLKGTPASHPNMNYWVGYLWDFKPRDVAPFQSMSSGFNVDEDIGAVFAMVRSEPMNGWHFVAEDYFLHDTINTGYGEARYDLPKAKDGPAWTLAVNDIVQNGSADNLITGDSFFTYQASAKAGVVNNSWTLFLAASTTGTGADIRFPYASKPNYTDMQQVSFDRAAEDAVVVGAAYDFTKHGWEGFSIGGSFGHGWDAINPNTGVGLPDRSEYDLFLQYRPTKGHWQGFRFQAKYANVFGDGLGVRHNQPELRLIADYAVLLKR